MELFVRHRHLVEIEVQKLMDGDLEVENGKEEECFEECVAPELVYVMEEKGAEDESRKEEEEEGFREEGEVDAEFADEEGDAEQSHRRREGMNLSDQVVLLMDPVKEDSGEIYSLQGEANNFGSSATICGNKLVLMMS